MSQKSVYPLIILLAFTWATMATELSQAERLNGWSQVNISQTELQGATVQIGGHTGIRARCHPGSLDITPDFSRRNTAHICPENNIHYSGTYGQILQVRHKTDSRGRNRYAIQVRVTDQGRATAGNQTEVGQVSWVYYDPAQPHVQLYNDGLATTHNLNRYLRAARTGQRFDIPWVTEPESPLFVEPVADDNRGILPENLVQGEEDVDLLEPGEERDQPALPGTRPEPAGEISEQDNRGVVPETPNMCSYEPQAETVDDGACMSRPPQKIGGKWRACPDRELKNIDRHAGGALKPWLINIVNEASQEVSEHATTDAGNSCASPAMMMTLMDQESTFHPMSYNRWNDHGIAQFQLGTAESTARWIQSNASSDSPMRTAIQRGLTWRPPGCSRTTTPWSGSLSAECLRSIQQNCEVDGRLVASLYCPQYAVRLQAFHIKQICAEPFYVDAETGQRASASGSQTINLTDVLLGEGDPATEARFIASRYNRGNRIFNSAVHYRNRHGSWPTAREYGKLWDVRRPPAFQRGGGLADPSPGGNLYGHTINRCYNWRTVGLCGGMQGTVFDQYRQMTCAAQTESETTIETYTTPDRGVR